MDIKNIKKAGVNDAKEIKITKIEIKEKGKEIKVEEISIKKEEEKRKIWKLEESCKKLWKKFWFIVWKDEIGRASCRERV